MLEIITIIFSVFCLIFFKIVFNVSLKKIKELTYSENTSLRNISDKIPDNKEVCKGILKILDNNKTKIKIESESQSCLYTVYNDTIILGKFKYEYIKFQTIAHECIHACQNKRILWANFIISNIYLIYFYITSILIVFNKLQYLDAYLLILIFLSIIQYVIRFLLENDAMLKAKYIAKEYIENNRLLNKDEEIELLKEYDKINSIGIPFYNYCLICKNIFKILIFSVIILIKMNIANILF